MTSLFVQCTYSLIDLIKESWSINRQYIRGKMRLVRKNTRGRRMQGFKSLVRIRPPPIIESPHFERTSY